MSLIKIHVIIQEINKKIEIVTHDLLRIYSINTRNTISILLPCPLDKIQILVDSTCFQFELKDNLEINIQHCTKCNNITTKKQCLCCENVNNLKMNITYISNGNISYCSKETLDILLRTIQYTYISTIKSMNDRSENIESQALKDKKGDHLKDQLKNYLTLRDVSHYWVIDKHFRNYNRSTSDHNFSSYTSSRYNSLSRAWYNIVKFSKHIRDSIYNFKIDILSVFGLGFRFFRKIKNEKKKITILPNQETKPNVLDEYLSYIYKHLGIILNYSNEEVLDMIRVILGLTHEMINQKNILKRERSSFEDYVYKKMINLNLEEAFEDLITTYDDTQVMCKESCETQVGDRNPDNTITTPDYTLTSNSTKKELPPACYKEKLKIINFICSLHKEIKSKQDSVQLKDLPIRLKDLPIRLKDLPIRLKDLPIQLKDLPIQLKDLPIQLKDLPIQLKDLPIQKDSRSHFSNGFHKRTKIEIKAESLFSNDKLVAFYLNNVKIHKSQNKPLQLTFEDDKKNLHNYLYKENSDLSVDLFFNSLTEYIYEIVECPYKLYNLLLISKQSGIIEMKKGRLISSFESVDQLKKYLILTEEDYTSLTAFDQFRSFSKSRIDNFLKSLAISLLICYLFEIRDRTPNNILIDNEGRVFNIDYEYTLGTSPSFLNPDIEIPSLISQLLKSDTLILNKFYYLLCNYYKIIRENYLKILMMSKILTNNKPTYFNQNKFERMFLSKLHLERERSSAEEMMMESFKKSLGSYKTKVKEFLACVKREITS